MDGNVRCSGRVPASGRVAKPLRTHVGFFSCCFHFFCQLSTRLAWILFLCPSFPSQPITSLFFVIYSFDSGHHCHHRQPLYDPIFLYQRSPLSSISVRPLIVLTLLQSTTRHLPHSLLAIQRLLSLRSLCIPSLCLLFILLPFPHPPLSRTTVSS